MGSQHGADEIVGLCLGSSLSRPTSLIVRHKWCVRRCNHAWAVGYWLGQMLFDRDVILVLRRYKFAPALQGGTQPMTARVCLDVILACRSLIVVLGA